MSVIKEKEASKNLKESQESVYVIDPVAAKLHISKGNSKLGKGIYVFSTLPGNESHLLTLNSGKIVLTTVPGTCSKYCTNCARDGACYAWRDAKLHHNVTIKAWGENTVLLRSGAIFPMIAAFINKKNAKFYKTHEDKDKIVRTFRINASGEVEDLAQFESWNQLALDHPEVTFGLYTKNFDDLGAFITKHGSSAPNLVINVSQWHGVADEFIAAHPGAFNIFEYDDTNRKDCDLDDASRARLAATQHCPAVTKAGRHATTPDGKPITCDMCKRCYRKTGAVTAVWSH